MHTHMSNMDKIDISELLARALQSSHPSHDLVTSQPGPRDMKSTFQLKFSKYVQTYMEGGIVPSNYHHHTTRSVVCPHWLCTSANTARRSAAVVSTEETHFLAPSPQKKTSFAYGTFRP